MSVGLQSIRNLDGVGLTKGAQGAATSVPAIMHAVRILRYLSQRKATGVTIIAQDTGISASSCFNILRTLAGQGLVKFNSRTKTYSLGVGMAEIASGLFGGSSLKSIRSSLDRIAKEYGVLLAIWHITIEEHVVLIERIFPDLRARVELQLAQRLPAFAGAVGRSIAAVQSASHDLLRKRFKEIRWQTPTTFEEYLAGVQRARKLGYAIDDGRLIRGVNSVAVPLLGPNGPHLGISGVTIAGQVSPEDLNRLGADLHSVVTAYSTRRGWIPKK
ncbi:MAG TPA: IclR family transcriptional regulator C-terminal domain-containing protein [Xanthobacteraceae bacterium]